MFETELTSLGLSEKEARIYMAVLQLNEGAVTEIARQAKVGRANTYVILGKLAEKGLVGSADREKKTIFYAATPRQLLGLLEEQKQEVARKEKEFKRYLPELETIFNTAGERPKIRMFEGKEGLNIINAEAIRDDVIRLSDKRIDAFFSVSDVENVFTMEERREQFNRRVAKGIRHRGIYTNEKGTLVNIAKGDDLRLVPTDKFPFTVEIAIFGDRISLASLKGKLVGVIIENKEITSTFRSIFNLAWEAAEKYKPKK